MGKKLLAWFFTLFFSAIGIAALGGAWMVRQTQREQNAQRLHATGTIVGIVEKRNARNAASWAPVIRFRTADGRDVEFVASVSGMKLLWKVGREVDVLYDAGNAGAAELDSWMTQWMPSAILAILGSVFLYVALKPAAPKKAQSAS